MDGSVCARTAQFERHTPERDKRTVECNRTNCDILWSRPAILEVGDEMQFDQVPRRDFMALLGGAAA
jgi:hypothetical protein